MVAYNITFYKFVFAFGKEICEEHALSYVFLLCLYIYMHTTTWTIGKLEAGN